MDEIVAWVRANGRTLAVFVEIEDGVVTYRVLNHNQEGGMYEGWLDGQGWRFEVDGSGRTPEAALAVFLEELTEKERDPVNAPFVTRRDQRTNTPENSKPEK